MATMQPPTVVANVVKYLRFIGKTPLDENKLELEGVIDLDPTTECILRKTPIDFRASRPDYWLCQQMSWKGRKMPFVSSYWS